VAYDDKLAGRVRKLLVSRRSITEKKMFGGLAFLSDGRMCCGVLDDELVVRVGPVRYQEALAEPHARPMDFTGKPLAGFVYVAPAGLRSRQALQQWVHRGVEFASAQPAKKTKRKAPRKQAMKR
jgi:TfoX/Sxy family transcriptional regulator of competence genes